ncbi:MAG: isochorismatase family protein [Desulfobacteraceae bacterium]|jgi:nicotinamidase-related amidase
MGHINNTVALLVIDMQVGVFADETPRYDAEGVVSRINAIARTIRKNNGLVIFIRHNSPQGETLEPGSPGWQFLPTLKIKPDDIIINKTSCDSFYNTKLKKVLDQERIKKVVITGCATDGCVDSTVRAAVSHDLNVIVAADGHTTADRPHVDAATLINYHNWLWPNLIHPEVEIKVMKTNDLIVQKDKIQ